MRRHNHYTTTATTWYCVSTSPRSRNVIKHTCGYDTAAVGHVVFFVSEQSISDGSRYFRRRPNRPRRVRAFRSNRIRHAADYRGKSLLFIFIVPSSAGELRFRGRRNETLIWDAHCDPTVGQSRRPVFLYNNMQLYIHYSMTFDCRRVRGETFERRAVLPHRLYGDKMTKSCSFFFLVV